MLLLDEPFESLAPATVQRACALIRWAVAAGKSVLASVHHTQFDYLGAEVTVMHLSSDNCLTGSWTGTPLATKEPNHPFPLAVATPIADTVGGE